MITTSSDKYATLHRCNLVEPVRLGPHETSHSRPGQVQMGEPKEDMAGDG